MSDIKNGEWVNLCNDFIYFAKSGDSYLLGIDNFYNIELTVEDLKLLHEYIGKVILGEVVLDDC